MSDLSDRFTFYQDANLDGNVIAVPAAWEPPCEGFRSTYSRPNSPVSWGKVSASAVDGILNETQARQIHPRLFDDLKQKRL